MHGIIFAELKKYAQARHGDDAWKVLLQTAGLPSTTLYLPIREYPDADAAAIVGAASQVTGVPAGDIMEDFGRFIAPDLLAMYRALVKPEWRTLEFLENTEETIHRVVRIKDKAAKPPEIRCERVSPAEVVIHYASHRKMCSVARGIARGVADHYGEKIDISEPSCMLRGDAECHIHVRVT